MWEACQNIYFDVERAFCEEGRKTFEIEFLVCIDF